MNIPSATVLASSTVRDWPSPFPPTGAGVINEARFGSLALRLGPSLRRASTFRIAPHAASFASYVLFNSHGQHLSVGESSQTSHDAPGLITLKNTPKAQQITGDHTKTHLPPPPPVRIAPDPNLTHSHNPNPRVPSVLLPLTVTSFARLSGLASGVALWKWALLLQY